MCGSLRLDAAWTGSTAERFFLSGRAICLTTSFACAGTPERMTAVARQFKGDPYDKFSAREVKREISLVAVIDALPKRKGKR